VSVFLQPIYTQTVGSGVASVTFNNIPQTFTDLKAVLSVRPSRTPTTWDAVGLGFNGDSSANYSSRLLYAGPVGVVASNNNSNASTINFINYASSAGATANTFGNGEVYIENYRSANFKQLIGDSVAPTNGTTDWIMALSSGLWRSTSAITSIVFYPVSGGTLNQYSTISLYGITKG
jgi:hypothetical protein